METTLNLSRLEAEIGSERQAHAALVQVSGLGVTFPNGLNALDGVDLTLAPGEFLSIAGPSGCGKSTLLRVLAGLLPPSKGRVEVDCGHPTGGSETGVAFVFQNPRLLPWRTVEGNVRLPLELRGVERDEANGLVEEGVRRVGLADFSRAFPHQLSGGMQMRVSLARALVTRPRLLLLDEPFGALDDITRQRLNEELLLLWERDNWTAVFVTHNVSEAVFLSQRVAVMSARPGRFLTELAIPFAYPRGAELRAEARFARMGGEIGAWLRRSGA